MVRSEPSVPSPSLANEPASRQAWSEADCLSYDPFAGDDYGNGFVDFGAKIVTGRGEYECHICTGPIAKGERHRVDSCILDGERLHARFCGLCCAAMAISDDDGGEAITAREPDRWPPEDGSQDRVQEQAEAEAKPNATAQTEGETEG